MGEPEEPLEGGSVNMVVRVGGTVRRPSGSWTPAIHALLRHLESAGFAESPRVLGVDDQDREVLTFIPGETVKSPWPEVMLRDDGILQLAELLRRFHDAVRSFTPPPDTRWRNPLAQRTGELVRHGDFAPFNSVWKEGEVIGLIDWDFAQPGDAITDLAYLAWYAVPLLSDERAADYGVTEPVDRARRLRLLCEAYGGNGPREVIAEAVRLIDLERIQTKELADKGVDPWTRFAADGNPAAFLSEARWIRRNGARLLG